MSRTDVQEVEATPPATSRWSLRRLLGAMVVAGAVPVVLATVLAFFGAAWWVADVAAAFRAQLAVLLAAAAVLAAVLGWRGAAAGIAVAALANAALVAPLFLSSPAPPADHHRLRVHAHNIRGGGVERFDDVSAELARSEADIVVLSELSFNWVSYVASSDLPYEVVHPLEWEDHRRVMVLSRIPVGSVDPVELVPGARAGGVAVDVALDGRPVRILALHAQSPRGPAASRIRDRELAAVADWVDRQDVPTVVAGDLNATPWSHAFRSMRREAGLVNSQRGFGLQPTWRAGFGPLMVPIDHVLHDPALTTVERSTGDPHGSAHRSLTVSLGWRAGAD